MPNGLEDNLPPPAAGPLQRCFDVGATLAEIIFRACSESGRPLAADLKSALVGDNPDQHKEREPASDLKHERAAPFHERCGCCFVFSALTLGSISGFGVRSVSISENATKRPRRRRSRRMRRVDCCCCPFDRIKIPNR